MPAEWASPTNDPQRPFEHIAFTLPFNMSEQPSAAINCGYTAAGLPIGLQITGRRHDDLGVLQMAARLGAAAPGATALAAAAGKLTRGSATFARMACPDPRGNPCGTRNAAARDAAESALWRMMSFYDTPLADLDAASAHDPGWALPHVMRAGFLLSLTEPSLLAEAATHLQRARELSAQAPPRERAHLEAVQLALDGRWQAACRAWDELLVEYPRDALALQWAQLWDFYRGDAVNLRARPARALPEWDEADPLYAHVLSLYAFGLEESNLYPQAEEIGPARAGGRTRRCRGRCTRWPMSWRCRAATKKAPPGCASTRPRGPRATASPATCGGTRALFRLEGLDHRRRAAPARHAAWPARTLQITLQRVDAAALLWRLHLLGVDVAVALRRAAGGMGPVGRGAAGYYAFNDVHAVLAMLGAGEVARAEAWVARCAERAMVADDARRSNHGMAREVGLPLMRGLLAFARGEADAAADALYAARGVAQRFGGSHAQRDVIDQTLLVRRRARHAARHRPRADQRARAWPSPRRR